jgi:formimidoylglutamate deiminase
MLERLGCTSEELDDGEDLMRALVEGPRRFDAVLLDIVMAHSNGLAIVRDLREHHVRLLPVIAATAYHNPGDDDVYARAGFEVAPNARQRRFLDPDVETCLRRTSDLQRRFTSPLVTVGLAPHSVRAVPKPWLAAMRAWTGVLHMHVSEQPAEIAACLKEHGRRPIELLDEVGLLGPSFTGVHAVHLEANEVQLLGRSQSAVCACPSTERNLGDGVVRADDLLAAGVTVSLGTDSQAHVDLLDDARQLEGHLRLLRLRRNVLAPATGAPSALAARLVSIATEGGARASAALSSSRASAAARGGCARIQTRTAS